MSTPTPVIEPAQSVMASHGQTDKSRVSRLHRVFLHPDVIVVTFILLVSAIVFWNVVRDPLRIVQEDIAFEWEGMHAVANEQIWQGHFPHWNPYGLGGERLFANILLGLFYPGSILFRFLPFSIACLLTWILHYSATALTTYVLARVMLKVEPAAAGLAGIVFALGGFCLPHCNHLTFVFAIPWLPLLLLATHQFAFSRGRLALLWWAVGCGCLGCLILSGGTPVLVLSLVALAWMMSVLTVKDLLAGRCWAVARLIAGVALMGVCAAGLTAFQLLPTLDLYMTSSRADWSEEQLLSGRIAWRTLFLQIIAPGTLGNQTNGGWGLFWHEIAVFVGGAALTLTVFGILTIRRRAWGAALLVLLLMSIMLALGYPPLLKTLNEITPVLRMRQPSRYVSLVHLAIALLAALGFHNWLTRSRTWPSWSVHTVCWGVFLLMSVSTVSVLHWLRSAGTSQESFDSWAASQSESVQAWIQDTSPAVVAKVTTDRDFLLTASFIVWCSGGLIVWLCSWLMTRRRKTAITILGGWVALEFLLFSAGTWAGQERVSGITETPPPVIQFMKDNLGDDRYFNAAVYLPLWENRGAIYGLPNVDGYVGSGLNVSRERDALFRQRHGSHRLLNLFSTKYILLREGREPGPLKPAFQDDGIVVYENPHRLPRAMFLTNVQSVDNVDAAIGIMKHPEFDPRKTGLLTGTTFKHDESTSPPDPSEHCRIARWGPGQIEIDVECQVPRWVLVSASYDKGWCARLGTQTIQLVRTNACFMSARVPPGEHKLVLEYETPQLRAGIAVTLATILLLACSAICWLSRVVSGASARF